jgi:rhomboid protease GluP
MSLFKVTYNAPVVLTFGLACVLSLVIDQFYIGGSLKSAMASPPSPLFSFASLDSYLRVFGHIFAHDSWKHLSGNIFLILLVGPLLEEKYGSKNLLFMILLTAAATGIVNGLFMPSAIIGASGIVFMLIILSGFTGFERGEIPLTFLLVVLVFLSGEVLAMFRQDNISQLAHIIGGVSGSLFGFSKRR